MGKLKQALEMAPPMPPVYSKEGVAYMDHLELQRNINRLNSKRADILTLASASPFKP